MKNDPSEFEKRRAFQEFNKAVTPELMIKIQEDFYIYKRDSVELMDLLSLARTFKHEAVQFDFSRPPDEQSFEELCFTGAIKRRDAVFMKLIAGQMFEPESQEDNPLYYRKIKEVATGTAPRALHAV